jgi:hypothetical protein
MIVLISYDLNKPTKDYSSFFETLKAQGHWWHYLKHTWLVDTQKTPGDIYEALRHHMDTTDRILITQMIGPYMGWLEQDAWTWIQQRLKP